MVKFVLVTLYELGTFYILFTIYRLCFAAPVVEDRRRTALLWGTVTAIIVLCIIFNNSWDVMLALLFVALIFGRRKIWDVFMLLPALYLYMVVGIIPGMLLKAVDLFPNLLLMTNPDMFLMDAVMDGLLIIILCYIYRYTVWHRVDLHLKPLELLGFTLYFVFALFLLAQMNVINKNYDGWQRVLLGGSCLVFYVIALAAYVRYLIVIRRSAVLKEQVKIEDAYIHMQLRYLEEYKNENQEIRELRHDLRGHLQVIEKLSESGKKRELENYIRDLAEKTKKIQTLQITGNQVADIVISAQKERAEQDNIEFTCKGNFACLSGMRPVDVCAVFTNLLDNAYEESVKVEKPYIHIEGIRHTNYFTLIVGNKTAKPVRINSRGRIVSSKGKGHGNGMGILQRTVAQYEGECFFACEGLEFTCKIILPLEKMDNLN